MSAGVSRVSDTEFRDPVNPLLIGTEGDERNRSCSAERGDTGVRFQIQMAPFPAAECGTNLFESACGLGGGAAPHVQVGGGDVGEIALSMRRFALLFGFATRGF